MVESVTTCEMILRDYSCTQAVIRRDSANISDLDYLSQDVSMRVPRGYLRTWYHIFLTLITNLSLKLSNTINDGNDYMYKNKRYVFIKNLVEISIKVENLYFQLTQNLIKRDNIIYYICYMNSI